MFINWLIFLVGDMQVRGYDQYIVRSSRDSALRSPSDTAVRMRGSRNNAATNFRDMSSSSPWEQTWQKGCESNYEMNLYSRISFALNP